MQARDEVHRRQRGLAGERAPIHGPLTSVAHAVAPPTLPRRRARFKAVYRAPHAAPRKATNAPFAAVEAANGTFVPNVGACQTAARSSARVQLFSNSSPERWKS